MELIESTLTASVLSPLGESGGEESSETLLCSLIGNELFCCNGGCGKLECLWIDWSGSGGAVLEGFDERFGGNALCCLSEKKIIWYKSLVYFDYLSNNSFQNTKFLKNIIWYILYIYI